MRVHICVFANMFTGLCVQMCIINYAVLLAVIPHTKRGMRYQGRVRRKP